jgi:hypothetical protein
MTRSGSKKKRKSRSPADVPPPTGEAAVSLGRLLWLLLALVPLVGLLLSVAFFSVNVPVWDDWAMVPMLQKAYAGTLSFGDLWEPYTQHRMVVPRLVSLAVARLTGWDLRSEMALAVACAAGLWLLLLRRAQRSASALGRASPLWLPALLALLVFGLSAHEDWFTGFQFYNPLLALTAAGVFCLFAYPEFRWGRLAGACLVALVATYSFGIGLLLWPLGAVALWWRRGEDRRYLTRALPVWLLLGVGNFLAYFHNFRLPGGENAPAFALGAPGEYLRFACNYLGAPLWFVSTGPAFWIGLVGILLLAGLAAGLIRQRREAWPQVQPYLLLALFAAGSALMTGLGRSGAGADKAMAPRYIPLSTLLWVAVVVLATLAMPGGPLLKRSPRQLAVTGLLAAMMICVAFFSLSNSQLALPLILRHYHEIASAPEAMRRGDDSCLSRLGPFTPEDTHAWREFLKQHHLSVWRGAPDQGPVP